MFDKLRNFNGVPNEYPKFLEGDTPFPIVGVRDLTTGFDSLQPDQKAVLRIDVDKTLRLSVAFPVYRIVPLRGSRLSFGVGRWESVAHSVAVKSEECRKHTPTLYLN
ncbi:UNVERIFIED_CONTAM: Glucose 1,6-bisphosphate synthase [Trichonephila clavipes]